MQTILEQAIQYHQAGQMDLAERLYRRVLDEAPDSLLALHNLGVIALQRGQAAQALPWLDRVMARHPDYRPAFLNAGHAHLNLAEPAKALACFAEAARLESSDWSAWFHLGVAARAAGRAEEALVAFEAAARRKPDLAEAWRQQGVILQALKRLDPALACLRQAVAADGNDVAALNSLALLLAQTGQGEEAAGLLRRAIGLAPKAPELYCNLGGLERESGHVAAALEILRQGAALAPGSAQIHNNQGLALVASGRIDEALAAYERSLSLAPDSAGTLANQGYALKEAGRIEEAVAAFAAANMRDPTIAAGQLFYLRRTLCDWSTHDQDEARLIVGLREGNRDVSPFSALASEATPAERLTGARAWSSEWQAMARLEPAPSRPSGRLRLGYLSGDFRRHPVASLIVEVFERHDRINFETFAYSYGKDDGSALRRRLVAAFDHFEDIRPLGHEAAARRIRDDGIDILIDLSGYTAGARPRIPAQRPAPVQVSHLGFPGTMGADFIDYVIADPFLLPFDQQPFYSEKIVQLPDCYQPSDSRRRAEKTSRTACGLPEQGTVLCCFNNSYKITPTMFDVWMRLLKAAPEAVLWLGAERPRTQANLRREAEARGVAAERIVFADFAPFELYLGRLALADLFLDCYPYSAGATANDALWMGLPILTCSGPAYVSRMSASLLSAVGLEELIAPSPAAYETLALALISDPERLRALKSRLVAVRETTALFDAERYARALEAAYLSMWESYRAGVAPHPFAVTAPTA